jgi:DNA-binding NtrC family response regulator
MGLLEKQQFSLLVLDLIMPHVDGEEILSEVVKLNPDLPVIVVTGQHEVSIAVRCMKLGAADYLTKPVEGAELVATVERSLEQGALRYECARLREQFFEGEPRIRPLEEIIVNDDVATVGYIEAISGAAPCAHHG